MMKIFKWKRYKKAKIRTFATLILLFISSLAYAQTDKNIRFKHLSVGDGLSQEVVNCIIQDRKGFMWFGTQDGLNRYDGYTFKVYKNDLNDKSAISDKYILCLYEDRDGNLWIGTRDGGLNRYNREKDSFINYKNDQKSASFLRDYDVRTICEDSAGDLWIGTFGGGLLRLDKKENELQKITVGNGLNDSTVNTIFKDSTDKLWIGTRRGLDYLDQNNGQFIPYDIKTVGAKESQHNVTAICEESKGNIWIGTANGNVFRLNGQGGRPVEEFSVVKKTEPSGYQPVRCLFKDNEGMLWVGTQRRLIRINLVNGESTEYENDIADNYSLSNNEVLAIYQDNTGIIWFGTYGGGLNIYDPAIQRFKLYTRERNNLGDNIIWAIYVDTKQRLWIGTYGGGLNLFDQKNGTFISYLEREDIRCIYEDNNTGILWIGTFKNGLFKFNPETKQIEKIYPYVEGKVGGLSDKGVMCILQTGPDEMWLGTFAGGLDKFNPITGEFTAYKYNSSDSKSISNDYVRAILKDDDGKLWVGTDGGGLNLLEDPAAGIFKHYLNDKNNPLSLSHNRVKSIYQDKSDRIWIGTEGGGLNLLVDKKKGQFEAFGLRNFLVPNDTVYGILEDKDGKLWMSTNSGLFKFSFKTGNGKVEVRIKNYDYQDGLQSNEFNTGAYSKNEKTGEMFFGSGRGLNSFFPNDIKDDVNKPPVILTDFLLFNKSVKMQSEEKKSLLKKAIAETGEKDFLTLTYKQNVITFEFAALSYTNPLKNKYLYKMDGYDWGWIETNALNRRATYTNLPAGEYIFRVLGSNKDGLWSNKEASLKLKIIPPPWETWWAYCLYGIALVGAVFLFVRFRLKNIAQELNAKEELEKQVKERTAFLEKIDAIVRSIHAEMEFTDFLKKILKEILFIKGVDTATALVWNPETYSYQFEAAMGLDFVQLKQISFTEEQANARYIANNEKIDENIYIIRNADKRPEFDKIPLGFMSKSMMVMQICPKNKTLAYLIFGNMNHENAFDDQDILLLKKLKAHILEAFQKARLIQQLQEMNKELKETSDQLIQAEKLSSLGTLLAGIAHELFNPAGSIMLNAEWFAKAWKDIAPLLNKYDADKKLVIASLPYKESREEIEKLLSGLLESSRRIKNLLDELKNFSRKEDRETKEIIDIDTVIHTAVDLTQNLIKKSTEKFSIEFGKSIPTFNGNSQRLIQVFINLIRNACEALPDNSHGISIATSYLMKTNEILIQVKDEGVGIEEKNLGKIMDPFFTTRQNSGGMGLGLSISQKIIRDEHHGRILFDTTPGQGTTVSIFLPVKPINVNKI